MSNLINKAKDLLHKDKGDNAQSDNYGPHGSNMANKVDPRVDSDLDGGRNANIHPDPTGQHTAGGYGQPGVQGSYGQPGVQGGYGQPGVQGTHGIHATPGHNVHHDTTAGGYGTGAGVGTGTGTGTYGTSGSTNLGPHNSNMANKLDPRVDSDADGRNNPTSTYGSSTSGGAYTGTTASGSTNAGPHNSNLMNKLDPRVDSDMDNRNDPSSRVGGYGTQDNYGVSGSNPTPGSGHHTQHNVGGVGGHNTVGGPGYGHQSTSGYNQPTGAGYGTGVSGGSGYDNAGAYGSSATPGSGDANRTAGPHNSNLMNKLDPRVDSDMDGSKTYGGNQTYR